MGEIAEMMLDGTMDPETGEWNFDGEDGPGFPMTGAQAARWKHCRRHGRTGGEPSPPGQGKSANARRRRAKRRAAEPKDPSHV